MVVWREHDVPTIYFDEDYTRSLFLTHDNSSRKTDASEIEAVLKNEKAIVRSVFWGKLVGMFENPMLKGVGIVAVVGIVAAAYFAFNGSQNSTLILEMFEGHVTACAEAAKAVTPTV